MSPQEQELIEAPQGRRHRLTPADRDPELEPLRRAHSLTRCFLYWIPVDSFPVPLQQRRWLELFFDRLTVSVRQRLALRPELFLQFKVVYPHLQKVFLEAAQDFCPMMGLSRRPGASLPPPPSDKDIKDIAEGRKQFDFGEFVPDYCYWFVDKADEKQRELFMGYGGLTMMFLAPDPATAPPALPFSPGARKHPLFQKFDIDRLHARTFAMRDVFQEKSKQLFGGGLESEPQFKGVRFVLPLLNSEDFFRASDGEVKSWFDLFEVYVNESPKDQGIIVASKSELTELLIGVLTGLREEGATYMSR
jgi:hypothetical protein